MRLAFDRGGAGAKPPLVLLHPMGADARFWQGFVEHWPGPWIAPDLRGAGRSPKAGGPMPPEAHAADLAALLDDLGVGQFQLAGCAVGAMAALALAALVPARTKALILSNPGLRTLPAAAAALAARAATARAGGMPAVLAGALDAAFAGIAPEDPIRKAHTERFAALDPAEYAFQIESILAADMTPHLPHVACPVLVVAGGRDGLLPPADHARPLSALLGDRAVFAEIAEGAHFIPLQRPAEFAALVAGFLGRIGDRGDTRP